MTADMGQHSPPPSAADALDVLLDLLVDRLADRMARGAQTHEDDAWLNLSDAAKYLDMHPDTLRKHAKAARVPYEQEARGCRMYFRRAALDAWRRAGGAPAHMVEVADLSAKRSRRRR